MGSFGVLPQLNHPSVGFSDLSFLWSRALNTRLNCRTNHNCHEYRGTSGGRIHNRNLLKIVVRLVSWVKGIPGVLWTRSSHWGWGFIAYSFCVKITWIVTSSAARGRKRSLTSQEFLARRLAGKLVQVKKKNGTRPGCGKRSFVRTGTLIAQVTNSGYTKIPQGIKCVAQLSLLFLKWSASQCILLSSNYY